MTLEEGRWKINERLILAAGFLLRFLYVLFSTIYERQYDIGAIDLTAEHTVSGGHLAYIQYLYQNGHLPDVDPTTVYQFHHPPFHYIVSAVWLRLASVFIREPRALEESLQVIPLICSLAVLTVLLKIVRQCGLRGRGGRIALSVFAFHPSLILLSGSVNNDGMGLLFTVLCIYEMIAWIKAWSQEAAYNGGSGQLAGNDKTSGKRQSWKHIVLLAVYLGFGIMTKQSVAELAFPIGIIFAAEFFRTVYEECRAESRHEEPAGQSKPEMITNTVRGGRFRSTGLLLAQYAIFLLISIPAAMWFYIRNYIRYRMPLVWVYTLPEDSWQYVGNVPVQYRFLMPKPSDLMDNIRHFQIGCGYNVWMQIFRTSVLGEWDMAGTAKWIKLLAVVLMLLGAVLGVTAFLCMIAVLFRVVFSKEKAAEGSYGSVKENIKEIRSMGRAYVCRKIWVFLLLVYLVNMVFYLRFAYDYPQECSMNFRYITVTLVTPALALGAVSGQPDCMWNSRLQSFISRAAGVLLALFCTASFLMTIVWCFIK